MLVPLLVIGIFTAPVTGERAAKDTTTASDTAAVEYMTIVTDPATEEAKADLVKVIPPAATGIDLKQKNPLPESVLEKKKEGLYFTGLPLINSDPDKGIGYGARVYAYYNGERDESLFRYTPYYHRVFAQYFRSTGGYQLHLLEWDSPYVGGSPFRLRSVTEYELETFANFYGIGEASMRPLRSPAAPKGFSSAEDFEAFNRTTGEYARYTNYRYTKPQWTISVERDLFGGVLRPLVGLGVAHYTIDDYSGKSIVVDDKTFVSADTRLKQASAAKEILGFQGGWANRLNLGLAYDTRDFEPDPNSGFFHELFFQWAHPALGSDYNFRRFGLALRQYYSPFTEVADLVLAGRAVYQVLDGEVPFFEMDTLAFSEGTQIGLGGLRTLRGLKQARYIGPVSALANFEIRWTFTDFTVADQHFAPMLVPFVDAGRVFDRIEDTGFSDWRASGGLGLRIAWNQATIIMIDYGMSGEGSGLYINFKHIY